MGCRGVSFVLKKNRFAIYTTCVGWYERHQGKKKEKKKKKVKGKEMQGNKLLIFVYLCFTITRES